MTTNFKTQRSEQYFLFLCRLKCHVLQENYNTSNNHQDLHRKVSYVLSTGFVLMDIHSNSYWLSHICLLSFILICPQLLQVMASSSRLEQKLDYCLWTQKVFIVLVMGLTALWGVTLYMYCSVGYSKWTKLCMWGGPVGSGVSRCQYLCSVPALSPIVCMFSQCLFADWPPVCQTFPSESKTVSSEPTWVVWVHCLVHQL